MTPHRRATGARTRRPFLVRGHRRPLLLRGHERPFLVPGVRRPLLVRGVRGPALGLLLSLLALSGCSGSDDTSAPGGSRGPAVSTPVDGGTPTGTVTTTTASPDPEAVRPAKVSGYEYGKASKGMKEAMGSVASVDNVFTDVSVNGVRRRGKFVGDLVIFRVAEGTAELDDFPSRVLDMVAGSGPKGTTVKKSTIAGQKVSVTTTGAARIFVWYEDRRLMMLMADKSLELGKIFVTAYVKAS